MTRVVVCWQVTSATINTSVKFFFFLHLILFFSRVRTARWQPLCLRSRVSLRPPLPPSVNARPIGCYGRSAVPTRTRGRANESSDLLRNHHHHHYRYHLHRHLQPSRLLRSIVVAHTRIHMYIVYVYNRMRPACVCNGVHARTRLLFRILFKSTLSNTFFTARFEPCQRRK